jgi:hypothetical protein
VMNRPCLHRGDATAQVAADDRSRGRVSAASAADTSSRAYAMLAA